MVDVFITKNINILLPDNRSIKVECPLLTEYEFNYFIDMLMINKQGLVIAEEQKESEEIWHTQKNG